MPDLSTELLAFGFIWYIAFLFSTTCHEAAHALTLRHFGARTGDVGFLVFRPWSLATVDVTGIYDLPSRWAATKADRYAISAEFHWTRPSARGAFHSRRTSSSRIAA